MIISANFDIRDISISYVPEVSFVHVSSYLEADKRGSRIQGSWDIKDYLEHNQNRWIESFNQMMKRQDPAEHFRAIFNDESMVGFIWFGPHKKNPEETGEIYSLYVSPDFWRQGIGRALFQNAMETLSGDGFKRAILETDKNDPLSNVFYKKHGGCLLPESVRTVFDGFELISYRFDL